MGTKFNFFSFVVMYDELFYSGGNVMNFKMLKEYCLEKRGAMEDFPFGKDVFVIKVEAKMFALLSERENKINISLKCDPVIAEQLREQYASVVPGYHLNKRNWNTVIIDDSIPKDDILWMIDHSYEMVVKGLPKIKQRKLLLNE